MAYKVTEEDMAEIRKKATMKKFTKDQMEALTAMKTFITTLKMSVGFSGLVTLQMKLLNLEDSPQQDLEAVRLWIEAFTQVMKALLHSDFQKDVIMLMEDLIEQFPDHIKQCPCCVSKHPEGTQIH